MISVDIISHDSVFL